MTGESAELPPRTFSEDGCTAASGEPDQPSHLKEETTCCYTQEQDYKNCTNSAQDLQDSGIPLGTAGGQVNVTSTAADSYEVVGTSKSGNKFTITKSGGSFVKPYTCSTGGTAGCATGGKW